MPRSALITGASGQDGWYLIQLLLSKGYRVHALSRSAATESDIRRNLTWHVGDVTNVEFLEELVSRLRPAEIYNFAALSKPQLSWDFPMEAAQLNAVVPHSICEIIRRTCPDVRFFQASSSEIFRDSRGDVQNENTPLAPGTPYGIAKAYAHRMVVAYRQKYGLHLSTGILFNHESPRRPLGFVSQKIAHGVAVIARGQRQSAEIDELGRPIVIEGRIHLGNTLTRRDFGFAGDYVEAIHAIVRDDVADDFVVGTGESHSIAEFCDIAFRFVGMDWQDHVVSDPNLVRKSDANTRADPTRLQSRLGFKFKTSFEELVIMMVKDRIELLNSSSSIQAKT